MTNPSNPTSQGGNREANRKVGRGAYRHRYPLINRSPISLEESGEIDDYSFIGRDAEGATASQYDNVTQRSRQEPTNISFEATGSCLN